MKHFFKIFIFSSFICQVFDIFSKLNAYETYEDHPCIRKCSQHHQMTCFYEFDLEWYEVITRNCLKCSQNVQSDCFEKGCVSANGVIRPIKVANRMLPGPSIQVCEGDTIVVNVKNNLDSFQATTIHWHGMKQQGTPFMDGVGMITQCPITPYTEFEYKFLAADVGTSFWHAHSSYHRADGLFGSIVVRSHYNVNKKEYDMDLAEHVIVLNDWLNITDEVKYTDFVHGMGDELVNGILIQGRGIDVRPDINQLAYETPRAEFHVRYGVRYRFRIINAGIMYCPLQVSIDNHYLKIIAVDGNEIKPIDVASFFIVTGERVDFVLNANQSIDTYWIKVKGIADCATTKQYQTAILRYKGSTNLLPTSPVTYDTSGPMLPGLTLNPINTKITADNQDEFVSINQLHPNYFKHSWTEFYLNKIKQRPDKKFYLSLDMNIVNSSIVYDKRTWPLVTSEETPWKSPQINNLTFLLPSKPLLFNKFPYEIVCDHKSQRNCYYDSNSFCYCLHTLFVDLGDVVEMVMADGGLAPDGSSENHAMHLHGQSYAVVAMEKVGDTIFMPHLIEADKHGFIRRNLVDPPLKDTVQVPSGGYTIIRFFAENPGYWLMHCHVENHADAGMMLIVKVGKERDLPPKPANWPTCGNFALSY